MLDEQQLRAALRRQTALLASRKCLGFSSQGRAARREVREMDITWITGRIAMGGGIWNRDNMAAVARSGVTHIIDMQLEFDDTSLAEPFGIEVLWNPTDDDFFLKDSGLLRRGVDFALAALEDERARLFVHCAAGVHRASMMTLAILCAEGWDMDEAMQTIVARRPVVDFAEVYVRSVQRFLQDQVRAGK